MVRDIGDVLDVLDDPIRAYDEDRAREAPLEWPLGDENSVGFAEVDITMIRGALEFVHTFRATEPGLRKGQVRGDGKYRIGFGQFCRALIEALGLQRADRSIQRGNDGEQ